MTRRAAGGSSYGPAGARRRGRSRRPKKLKGPPQWPISCKSPQSPRPPCACARTGRGNRYEINTISSRAFTTGQRQGAEFGHLGSVSLLNITDYSDSLFVHRVWGQNLGIWDWVESVSLLNITQTHFVHRAGDPGARKGDLAPGRGPWGAAAGPGPGARGKPHSTHRSARTGEPRRTVTVTRISSLEPRYLVKRTLQWICWPDLSHNTAVVSRLWSGCTGSSARACS